MQQPSDFQVSSNAPFRNAILASGPELGLPNQGLLEVDRNDLSDPMSFTEDLATHKNGLLLYLWNSLSNETQAALLLKNTEITTSVGAYWYKQGQEIPLLVANLNALIHGKLLYNSNAFESIYLYLSGDTSRLLAEQPSGQQLARLNRLLLEDAFSLDIRRRPKILRDSNTENLVFVDFSKKSISLYDAQGGRKWTADVGSTLAKESVAYAYTRVPGIPPSISNIGLWDVRWDGGNLLFQVLGNHFYELDAKTGAVHALDHY
jgi:hypothetical protein